MYQNVAKKPDILSKYLISFIDKTDHVIHLPIYPQQAWYGSWMKLPVTGITG